MIIIPFFGVYPKIKYCVKFLLFYPDSKGDKMNFKSYTIQKQNTSLFSNSIQVMTNILYILYHHQIRHHYNLEVHYKAYPAR